MNSEELELSLRAEFESYVKNALAGMRREVSELQKNFETEFEKHRSQMDEAFRNLSARFDSPVEFDKAFTESVTEHLRLARDEGAQITATALGEAEKLGSESMDRSFAQVRSAVNEIRNQQTQAAILKSLVEAAENFAPRGAFFIVKNDHLVGWKVFGDGDMVDENTVRSIHFPIASDTLLSRAVQSLSTQVASADNHSGNEVFLAPLGFHTQEMFVAVPLAARGRGVAVLYADGGEANGNVNFEALETLVSVAGLTVELLAAAVASVPVAEYHERASERAREMREPQAEESAPEYAGEVSVAEEPVPSFEPAAQTYETFEAPQQIEEPAEEVAAPIAQFEVGQHAVEPEPTVERSAHTSEFEVVHETAEFGPPTEPFEVERLAPEPKSPTTEYSLSHTNFSDASEQAVEPQPEPEMEHAAEPFVQEAAPPQTIDEFESARAEEPKPSRRERTVDLPIEVADHERRSHSDARRFARLLVSEIRLYNEQKVVEGRESGDIYEILKEAIDRSREMYDKRVQPDVASKFDYFHYELVNNLADGEEEKLGAGYLAVKV